MDNNELNLGMFKAYDIRTKMEKLDGPLLERLVYSIGRYMLEDLRCGSVVVCRDARIGAPAVLDRIVDIFPSIGLDVLVNPLQVSTCQFYYSCMRHPSSAGIMVTASHNPKEYVGFKLMAMHNVPLASGYGPSGGIDAIKRYYLEDHRPCVAASRGRVSIISYMEDFIRYSMSLAGVGKDSLKGLKVMGEFLCGSAGAEVSAAFGLAGASFQARNLIPNGLFPAGDPNPIIESSIAPARLAMKSGDFDLGFCFDGDGDRMDLMDGTGNQIVPGFNIAVLIPYILDIFRPAFKSSFRPKFYADVKAIPTALAEIAGAGIDVHMIRNGHSFIKAKLMENFSSCYLASEEESAHYYMNFPVDPDDWGKGAVASENTLFFSLLTARAWMENPGKYEHMRAMQRSFYRVKEWPLYFDNSFGRMQEIMDEVEALMAAKGAAVVKRMDDGSDLDAVLMRFNLPESITPETRLDGTWCQVAERISRSEDAMTRWEVVSSDESMCRAMNDEIRKITDRYVASGCAHYGE